MQIGEHFFVLRMRKASLKRLNIIAYVCAPDPVLLGILDLLYCSLNDVVQRITQAMPSPARRPPAVPDAVASRSPASASHGRD